MRDIQPRQVLGLILLLVVIGAGATAGVTLFGKVTGESVTTVNQAVFVPADNFNSSDVTSSSAVVSVGGQGATFAVGAEVFQGETYNIFLPIDNKADNEITVELVLKQVAGPDPLIIDTEATAADEFNDGCNIDHVVQVDTSSWRFKLGSTCNDRVDVQVEVLPDASPGFYKIQGTLKPLEGIE